MNSENTTLWSVTLSNFRDQIASESHTPGGGSVSAVTSTFGIALVVMALEISIKRKNATGVDEMRILLLEARSLLQKLSLHADHDIAAFDEYMSVLRLPRQTPGDQEIRKKRLEEAIVKATQSPISAAKDTVAAILLAKSSCNWAHPNVLSDVAAGAAILGGSLAAVLYNVDINLSSLSDAERRTSFANERKELMTVGQQIVSEILSEISSRLSKSESK